MLDSVIPIDVAISAFKNHLLSHSRTILSAKYGDGKTYFLSQFVNDATVKENFDFLTIYPVNYQVLENKDIFDLIKRDLLLQMISKGMMETYEIPDNVALAFYLQNKCGTVAEAFLPFLQALDSTQPVAKALIAGLAGLKMFRKLRENYKKWKNQFKTDDQIETYLIENDGIIYENDAITEIIRSAIANYKSDHPQKRVVLIIEDLDRIDPAHLFRILNVFSAHMDYGYRLGKPIDNKFLVGNKFDLDNVVMVMDYQNTCNIFHHFYGESTNFKGYIDKFCSNNYFRYSLAEQKYKYFISNIKKITGLNEILISPFFKKDDVANKSVRDINKCFVNIDKDLLTDKNAYKGFCKSIPRLLSIARRYGLTDADILKIIEKLASNCMDAFFKYAGPYLSVIYNDGTFDSFHITINGRNYAFNEVRLDSDGTMLYTKYYTTGNNIPQKVDLSSLLSLISK
jgi:hypothetical protein